MSAQRHEKENTIPDTGRDRRSALLDLAWGGEAEPRFIVRSSVELEGEKLSCALSELVMREGEPRTRP